MMRRIIAMSLLVLLAAYVAVGASPLNAASEGTAATIAALIVELASLSLPPRVERAFLLTLNAAADAARDGQTARAQTLLQTFAFEVRGVKRAKRLPPETANPLIETVEKLIATMAEPGPR